MKWFDKKEFEKAKKLIDTGDRVKELNDWFWNSDFKNNATTLAMAYIYNMMNLNKCSACADKLKSLLSPKGKTGPLEYNDVVSEIWNNDNSKALKSIGILIDNDIPFAIKDGIVLTEFLTNPKLKKIADHFEKNPGCISKYMKKKDLDKVKKVLLDSDNYELVKKGLSQDNYNAINGPKFRKRNVPVASPAVRMQQLLEKTIEIKNKNNRVRYIKEEILRNRLQKINNIFDSLHIIYASTDFTADDIVEILKKASPQNVGSGTPSELLFYMNKKGEKESIKTIAKNWETDIWVSIILEIRQANLTKPATNEIYKPDWLIDYIETMGKENAIMLLSFSHSNVFVSAVLKVFSEETDRIINNHSDKLPDAIKDIFFF